MAQRTIAIFACEASGDVLGGALMRHMAVVHPGQFHFVGIGGPEMRAAGLDVWYESEALSVMGFVEVLAVLPRLLAMQRDCKRRIRQGANRGASTADKPTDGRINMVIGIDAPDFNFALERTAKVVGIPALHWVSPSVWAWREKRLTKIKQCVDEVLCLFPMELPYYERYGIKATFVGHPLADRIHPAPFPKPNAQGGRTIALLPGSRRSEVKRLMPVYKAWLAGWRAAYPHDTIIIPAATPTIGAYIRTLLVDVHDNANIHIQAGDAQGAMRQADAVVLASGTATLEAMLLGKPMVVVYKVAWLSAWIYRARLATKYVSLPNHLLNAHTGKDAETIPIVPELLQDACTPSAIHQALEHTLKTPPVYLAHFERISEELRQDAILKVAARVLAYADGNAP